MAGVTHGSRRLAAPIVFAGCVFLAVAQHVRGAEFKHVVIDKSGPKDPWAKILGDISGDGRLDVVIGGRSGPLVWYRWPDWEKTLIAKGGYQTVDGEVGDIDGDGDLDVVMGGTLWYENPRIGGKAADSGWRAHRIAKLRSHDIEVGDLDGDRKADVVSRDQSGFGHKAGNKVYVWKQKSPDSWSERIIDCGHGEGLLLGDIDRDGDLDILIGASWLENTENILNGKWQEHKFAEWHEDTVIAMGDLNGDKRPDVVLARSEGPYRISWFEQPADPKRGDWKEHAIDPSLDFAHGVVTADMDGDGDLDVVTAEMHQSKRDRVLIYFNSKGGALWTPHVLSTKGSHNLRVGDIGNDGRLDVMGANWSGPYQPIELWMNHAGAGESVRLIEDAVDKSAAGLAAYKIKTPSATYWFEKTGAGLSSMIDRDGIDWLGFHPKKGSGAGGEYRGFPNAVHQQAGSYFHPKNAGTDRSTTKVEHAGPERVSISAVSDEGHWACRYDFHPTHCTFTMTKMPSDKKYWVLYEGTPGGSYDDTDWWMTSAVKKKAPLTETHEGDIPAPEWIAFGDARSKRSIVLVHHEDDGAPDRFYPMQKKMTVFGFGRKGIEKYIDTVPQHFSIAFVESTNHDEIARAVRDILN